MIMFSKKREKFETQIIDLTKSNKFVYLEHI